jgi:hypothetical protein
MVICLITLGALALSPVGWFYQPRTSWRLFGRFAGVPMTTSLIFVCLFVLVGLTGAPGHVGISWAFAGLGLFLTIGVLLMLMPGRQWSESSPSARRRS